MESHILALPGTTKFSDKSFIFKKSHVDKGLPEVAVTGLGTGAPGQRNRPSEKHALVVLWYPLRFPLALEKLRVERLVTAACETLAPASEAGNKSRTNREQTIEKHQ
jgi:hypothetical protein